jgi:hypothetical protein
MGTFDFFYRQLRNDVEFSSAHDTELYNDMFERTFDFSSVPPYNPYSVNGINVETSSDRTTLFYNGLLAKNGAEAIYAVVGHGSNNRWEDVNEYPMWYTGNQTFVLYIPSDMEKNINIAFRDSSGNWDNNSGKNYSFDFSSYGDSH